MIFIQTGQAVIARALSSIDLRHCLNENDFGAMVHSVWSEDPETRKELGPDASREILLEAFMSLKLFASYGDMLEESYCPLETYIQEKRGSVGL